MDSFPDLRISGIEDRLYDMLLGYFEDPVSFRQLQAETRFLISGSQALKIIGGVYMAFERFGFVCLARNY
jgi:hypothetical protein